MSNPSTVDAYINGLPQKRTAPMKRLMNRISENLPEGFESVLNYGMPSWVVPHRIYPAGYHPNPKLPLPFLSIASQKSHIAVYHMGIYASPPLLEWFVETYPQHCNTKLNMGKSCIRFTNTSKIPHDLIGELCRKLSPQQWIKIYEEQIKK